MSTAILWSILILLLVLLLYFAKYNYYVPTRKEGFTVKTCPSGTTSYITDDGFTNCCSGEVINNYCQNIRCSLSPGSPVINCTTYGLDLIARNNANYCKAELAGDCVNYFTNPEGTIKGCSKSNLNSSRTGPSDLTQPYCRIYSTTAANTANYDSCQNYLVRYNAVAALATCNSNLATANSNADAAAAARTTECSRFNEAKYLELNPDVKAAVDSKQIPSGKWHYANQALRNEDRQVC
jgi:hypothetical protein